MGLTRFSIAVPTDRLRSIRPEGIHAVTCSWVDRSAHHADRKPVSTTPPYETDDGRVAYDVVTFTDEVARTVQDGARDRVRFGRMEFPARSLDISVAEEVSWDELLETPPATWWLFECLTPLVIRSATFHGVSVTPGTFFGHLRRVWRLYSDVTIDIDFEEMGLIVDSHDLETVQTVIRGHPISGFLGSVAFRALAPTPDGSVVLSALARLAGLTGVGSRTTYGMGVVRPKL